MRIDPLANNTGPLGVGDSAADSLAPISAGVAASVVLDPNEQHIRTDHLLENLTQRTISSGVITVVAQGAKFVLNLASTIVLSRLLLPDDFGLIAMATTVTAFLRVFKDAGLSTATVQREGISQAQVSNLFWVNVAVSTIVTVIVAALAPGIAWFYHDPRLVTVTLLLSTTFIISGSTVQHQALLNRQMRFKALAFIEVGSMSIGFLTGVIMAVMGYGYWALIGSSLALEISGLLLTWAASSWRPNRPARGTGMRPLLSFGVDLTAGSFIYYISRGIDVVLIGRFYGADVVGYYSRATALLMRPMEQCLCPITSVFMPVLSRLQSQPDRYRRTFMRVYETVALVSFPCSALLLGLAHPLTLVLLGQKWEKAADIFAALTIAALIYPVTTISSWLFPSQGRGRDMLLTSVISSGLTIASIVAGLPFGGLGVAVAFSASGLLIRLPVLNYIAGKNGPVSTKDLWIGFLRYLPVWVIVLAATWLAREMVGHFSALGQLLIAGAAGGLAALAFIYVFPPSRRIAEGLLGILLGSLRGAASGRQGSWKDQLLGKIGL